MKGNITGRIKHFEEQLMKLNIENQISYKRGYLDYPLLLIV